MFELKISDLVEAKQLSQQWATHTISLLDPGIEHLLKELNSDIKIPVAMSGKKLRRYYFHDIVNEDDFLILLTEDSTPTLATPAQIKDILAFTVLLNDKDKLLIHCQAGISRSTAVACGVLCQYGLTPLEAIQYVYQYAHKQIQINIYSNYLMKY
ncbi:protein tyrosine phosphatase [Beggiatoa sp. PS]|nr:protein tyrosine phosphatase [Beggiatoa sp. PS]